jgi:hypothetical protein
VTDLIKRHRLGRYLDELPAFPSLRGDAVVGPDYEAFAANCVEVTPESLDDLKAWIGIPNDVIDHSQHQVTRKPVQLDQLPRMQFVFGELGPEEQGVVEAHAYNLLFGPVEPDLVAQSPLSHVVEHLLSVNERLTVVVGDDLVVQDGQTVTLTTPTCCFNSITVYGSGTIQLGCDCKVITNSLTYIPSGGGD